MIVEITGVNLPRDLKQYNQDDRFVAYVPGGTLSDPTSFREAVRAAIALGDEGCVGFLPDEPAPAAVKPDYSKPLPRILNRKKRVVPVSTV